MRRVEDEIAMLEPLLQGRSGSSARASPSLARRLEMPGRSGTLLPPPLHAALIVALGIAGVKKRRAFLSPVKASSGNKPHYVVGGWWGFPFATRVNLSNCRNYLPRPISPCSNPGNVYDK